MTAHKHAHLIAQYAVDAAHDPEPWKYWELKADGGAVWADLTVTPGFHAFYEYRRKSDAPIWPPAVCPRDSDADKALTDRLETIEAALASLQTQFSSERLLRTEYQKDARNRMDAHAEMLSNIDAQLDNMPSVETVQRRVAEKLAANITSLQNELCEDEGCPYHGTPHVCVSAKQASCDARDAKRWRKYLKTKSTWGCSEQQFIAHVDDLPDHD